MRSGQSFDRFAADYDRFASLEPAGIRDWLLRQLPAHGNRALDAGGGAGRHTQALAERFDEVVGVDISEPLMDIARRERSGPNVRYLVTDLMSFTDADGFDLVFSSTALHHVKDLDAGLLLLRGLVRPGGGIAILIDNVASRPTPPRWVHVLGALRQRRWASWRAPGVVAAEIQDQPTLAGSPGERSLSLAPGVRAAVQRVFPGGRFHNLGYAHGLVWARKNPAAVARGHEVRREP